MAKNFRSIAMSRRHAQRRAQEPSIAPRSIVNPEEARQPGGRVCPLCLRFGRSECETHREQ